ncbi:unnamed protein product [Adineta steineri]|uniref:Uncharacterized protein n=1 Tax=Adineta steineri TaxID=433720 RepID=A0A818H261_9BILA|nr:unnamed protein product [Adineta steineri]CAF1182011.1 unnamed protein product [Adineta steineri]CAF3500291.1 unnamed protein product [Adineta steineri]CAF4091294.1 unnamed protein product [Adineta steineri]
MANGYCNNTLCADRETQLRLARLREELLTNFNGLLLDRIRFLEQTISQLSSTSSSSSFLPSVPSASTIKTTTSSSYKSTPPAPTATDRVSTPSLLRRSSSTTAFFLQSPSNQTSLGNGAGARSCPSSVDLSASDDRRSRYFLSKKNSRSQTRTSSESTGNYLSIPMDAQWSSITNDFVSSSSASNEKGRLESRRFATDVDDNEVRAFKAMIYMEQARKQHARPLTRLRQALGISSNSTSAGSYTFHNSKKHSNA